MRHPTLVLLLSGIRIYVYIIRKILRLVDQSLEGLGLELVNIGKGAFELFFNNKRFVVSSFLTTVQDGRTLATLQFPFVSLPFVSLPEGRYRLVTHAAKIKTLPGQAMASDHTDSFFRLFGDVNGDRTVNSLDAAVFNTTFGKRSGQAGYLSYLDYDGNGRIDSVDRRAFKARLGKRI